MDQPQRVRDRSADALRASAVFGSLPEPVIAELTELMSWRHVHGGETVIVEGAESDSIIFVISGALRVSRRDRDGSLLLYNQIHPGQSIGELGMILQQPRAQDVSAIRDSTLALLDRQAYETLLLRHPLELSRVFMRAVYDRLRHGSEVQEQRLAQTFVLVPLHEGAGAGALAAALVNAFVHNQGMDPRRVGHLAVEPHGGRTVLNGELLDGTDTRALEDSHEMLVYEAEERDSAWTRYAFRQADQVIFVASAGSSSGLGEIEALLRQEPGFAFKRKHLVLMHPPGAAQPEHPAAWLHGRELERIYPLRQHSQADAEHLARFLTSSAVGIVLGGGGARGFAHLGVLKALNECHIPVDLIGGNSMGALIGAQLACGHGLDQILEQTRRFASGGERLTLPLVSLVGGRRVERDLRRLFGEQLIEQLWRPFFAAACNLSRGNTTVQDQGLLWRAVLASNSPAGLLPPVLQGGELLVDGAILENVPVQPMRMRLGTPLERRRGNGKIIAIDVDVRAHLRADAELQRLTPWSTLRAKLRANAPASPGLANILYSAGHIGGSSQRGRTIAQADLYLEPPVAEFALMAYQRGADIAEIGYRYAMEKIAQWDRQKMLP
ncbi:patatin-like phospholipase family protein [Paucibacter sp. APW11]|uniref:Patatin-like phospholipase family protein n=1 Tax=Roseateles aquae TaxID=3077235 RepID=A0ABU3P7W9_9BURK|nr:patatin-like phospholipase family protein [Paucibacter sp. APW11]MDT8998676.1 patatin-like phospholipase family protein [Paucibacter sp. APW11]